MPDKECIDRLGGWAGYCVTTVTRFEKGVKANSPQAEVVFDLFHVVAKYGRSIPALAQHTPPMPDYARGARA